MTTSAFGVELGKGLRFGRPAKKAAESAAVHLDFKPIKPGVKPVGPGSLRRVMDPSAHETRLAAERRRELGKAFGDTPSPKQVGRLSPAGQKTYRRSRDAAGAGIIGGGVANMAGSSLHSRGRAGSLDALAETLGEKPGSASIARIGRYHRQTKVGAAVMRGGTGAQVAGLAAAGTAAALGSRAKRKRVGKSAFGVEGTHVPTAVGRLKPVPPATAVKAPPRKLDTAIAATGGTTS